MQLKSQLHCLPHATTDFLYVSWIQKFTAPDRCLHSFKDPGCYIP